MKFFTTATIAASVAALLSAQALAATTAPLTPGKPSGMHKAQSTESWLIPVAIAGAAVGVIVAVSGNGNGGLTTSPVVAPPTTTS